MMSPKSLDSPSYTFEYFLLEDICRLCWSRNAERDINSKYSEKDDPAIYTTLIEQIDYCLDIDLRQPGAPNRICNSCCSKLDIFCQFKTFCSNADRKLQEILSKNCVELITDVDVTSNYVHSSFENIAIEKTDTLESFLDALHNSASNNSSDIPDRKISKARKKYKKKKSPTYCNICRIDLITADQFSVHNAKSHGIEDDQFKCFGCEKRFKSRKTRLGHEINFCKGLKDGYKCDKCDRHLPKRRMYESHMRDHKEKNTVELPEDLFKCAKCSKLFKTKVSLTKHMVSHETTKNYICETCGRVFTRQDYLYKHKLTHAGIKQHMCPHCDFRATQRSSLTVHIRKHTGERPYWCDMCPQQCISSSNLRAHRRRHLGVKKYQCTICPKKFGYKLSLEEHVASMHEREQSHPCVLCGAVYIRSRGLRRHLLAKHNMHTKQKGHQVSCDEKETLQNNDLKSNKTTPLQPSDINNTEDRTSRI